MTLISRRAPVAAALLATSIAGHAASLCMPDERVVFSCTARPKLVSVCAVGDLGRPEGRLVYRFGRDAAHVELAHGADKPPHEAGFRYLYDTWGKGESTTLTFQRGGYGYFLQHAHGAFGVDGGDNFAELRVMRDDQLLATIRCDEPSAVDRLYRELDALKLPSP